MKIWHLSLIPVAVISFFGYELTAINSNIKKTTESIDTFRKLYQFNNSCSRWSVLSETESIDEKGVRHPAPANRKWEPDDFPVILPNGKVISNKTKKEF